MAAESFINTEQPKSCLDVDVKEEQLEDSDDLSDFDAHRWALDHVKVEVKDEPLDLPDVDVWRFVGDAGDPKPDQEVQESKTGQDLGRDTVPVPEPEKELKQNDSNELWVTVVTNQDQAIKSKTFSCQLCRKGFSTKGNLNNHMRSHNGEKPFMCTICGRQFSFNCNLNTHIRTHTGIKPFKCEVCGKCFITKGNLQIHARIHTGEKPFHCKHCGRGFTVKDNLNRHLRTHIVI